MATTVTQKTIRAVTGAAIKRIDGTLLVLPDPSQLTLERGIEEIITEARNPAGDRVDASSYIDAYKPAFSLTFPFMTPELLAMQLGKQLEVADFGATVDRLLRITATNQNYTGATAGQEGEGMVADQAASVAYVLGANGISTMLTRVNFADFDTTSDNTFAQGANGAYAFANSQLGCSVRYSFPLDVTQQPKLSEIPDLQFQINVGMVMVNGEKLVLEMPSAQIDLGQGDISFGGEVPVRFRSTFDGSSCRPLEIKFLGQTIAC